MRLVDSINSLENELTGSNNYANQINNDLNRSRQILDTLYKENQLMDPIKRENISNKQQIVKLINERDCNLECIHRLNNEIENLRQTNNDRTNAINEAREIIKKSLRSEFSTLDFLAKEYYQYSESKVDQNKVFKKINKILQGIRNDKKVIEDLKDTVNSRIDNLMCKFETDYPNLKYDDVVLFLFIVLDFSGKAIGFFMKISDDAVYSRKRALRLKLEKYNFDVAKRYIEYF